MNIQMTTTNTLHKKALLYFIFTCIMCCSLQAQSILKGRVTDKSTKEGLAGCTVYNTSSQIGAITDTDGRYEIAVEKGDTVTFEYLGYNNAILVFTGEFLEYNPQMTEAEAFVSDEVVVSASRISEKITESTSSIQKMTATQIQSSASGNFYQGLGNLKEIDINTSSMGFQVLNTRGFNTTSPVRIVQFIDGMDNQAPGLNFPVGNLVGASDIDLESVELISGAASALYGANAYQGVVSMTTKNPWDYQGLTVKVKGGSRAMFDLSMRYANTLGKKDKFGFKVTAGYFRGNEWIADDSTANLYGDISTTLDLSSITRKLQYSDDSTTAADFRALNAWLNFYPIANPGKKEVFAPGYMEGNLTDKHAESLKAAAQLAYKFNDKLQISYDYKFGRGTAVYQGSNRYSVNNILFQQHKLQLTHPNFQVKAYTTLENAGDSYDMVFAAINLSKAGIGNYAKEWIKEYFTRMKEFTNDYDDEPQQWMVDSAKAMANNTAYANAWLIPGTPAFDSAYNSIKGDADFRSGAKFQDKSSLQHIEGQYNKEWNMGLGVVAGASFRNYRPQSYGTIFKDTLTNPADTLSDGTPDPKGDYLNLNTWEMGGFVQASYKMLEDHLKIIGSVRVDKHENFKTQFSPRISVIGNWKKNTFRFSAQSAFRAPTLQNQYILLDLGPLLLKGNIAGTNNAYDYQSVQDFQAVYDTTFNIDPSILKTVNIAALQPEQLKSFELGYRGVWAKNLYVDIVGYFNIYSNFIGDLRVVEPNSPAVAGEETGLDAVLSENTRLVQYAVNAKEDVTSYGISVGLNYYIWKSLMASANYTWTDLNTENLSDPIIPGFNTPNHKFNIGLSAKKIWKGFGFNTNFKWVSNYLWESSFGDGNVPSFYLWDVQVNYEFPKWFTVFAGGSNITNNKHIEAYGSPMIGGTGYAGLLFNIGQ
ncbi:MAG: TonB-dependent receptor [Chitinophagales bacterium]|nr:TonB-dependent receptor [Chitinophagales bacterium]